ncbi:MAG: hypothetical protein MJ063_06105 [Lachnospiraceae bacterium]|nr:hypothetical protein [Lachnospiraceae bacterium]
MDTVCYDVLAHEQIKDVTVIQLQDFEDNELLTIKKERSRGEYCWSCTAKLIKYVLTKYKEKQCTYIDADMKFYSNPIVLIEEMERSNCSVQVVPHRFAPDYMLEEREKSSGKNCVQFNTFCNTKNSLALLDKWINDCIRDCSLTNGGDQKYTDSWDKYSFVNISSNMGAGVAPWNINRYKLLKKEGIIIQDRYTKERRPLVFYHFQDLVFTEEGKAIVVPYLRCWSIDKILVNYLYTDYLSELYEKNRYIFSKYNINCSIQKYITETIIKKKSFLETLENWHRKSLAVKRHIISIEFLRTVRKSKAEFDFH